MNDIILGGNIFSFDDDDFDFMRLYDVSEVMIQPKRQKIKRRKLIDKTIEFETEFILEVAFRKTKPMEINEVIKELQSRTKKTTSDDKEINKRFIRLTRNEVEMCKRDLVEMLLTSLQNCKTDEEKRELLYDSTAYGEYWTEQMWKSILDSEKRKKQ